MNDVLLFAGTTEGRRVAEACRGRNVTLHVCVATEYGEALIEEAENVHVLSGRLNAEGVAALLRETGAKLVIDATHPYAEAVTRTLQAVCSETGTDYLRLLRREDHAGTAHCVFVDSTADAVAFLNSVSGSALLTVGAKELAAYTAVTDYKPRLFARVLSLPQSVEQAAALGFEGRNLISMQGPFTEEFNAAMLKMLGVDYLVTKDTGAAGGFPEKLRAAENCGVKVVVIRRPLSEEGVSLEECLAVLGKRFGFAFEKEVTILGVGAGSAGSLTVEAEEVCRRAELIIGAARLTKALARFQKPTQNAIAAKDIAAVVRESEARRIVVAMSGDTGFYSGAKTLLPLLQDLHPTVLPGVSSIAYFCSRIKTSWDDALLISTHGRSCNYLAKIRRNAKVLALTGGKDDAAAVITALCDNGLGHVLVTVGEDLSYENEKITAGTASELAGKSFAPLAVLLAENPSADSEPVTGGLPDEAFLRAEVPMTKQEIRAVTLAKLTLTKRAVCWDVGAGTGSVSLEMARFCEDGEVFAIEQKAEACELIERNKRHLGISNVTVVPGAAPEALRELPTPTHVFIGGSSGNLKGILTMALEKNPRARIVLNTVTAETFAEAVEAAKTLPVHDFDIAEISAARGRKLGGYHLMTAQNPVFIISFTGGSEHA